MKRLFQFIIILTAAGGLLTEAGEPSCRSELRDCEKREANRTARIERCMNALNKCRSTECPTCPECEECSAPEPPSDLDVTLETEPEPDPEPFRKQWYLRFGTEPQDGDVWNPYLGSTVMLTPRWGFDLGVSFESVPRDPGIQWRPVFELYNCGTPIYCGYERPRLIEGEHEDWRGRFGVVWRAK